MTYTEARRPLTEEGKGYYKREIKEQFDLYETAMDNYDELADFSLEDLE